MLFKVLQNLEYYKRVEIASHNLTPSYLPKDLQERKNNKHVKLASLKEINLFFLDFFLVSMTKPDRDFLLIY